MLQEQNSGPPGPAMPVTAQRVPPTVPRLDHHQHLMNEGARNVTVEWLRTIDTAYARQSESEPLVDADQLVQLLDEAGIAKALVLSNAYWFSRSATELMMRQPRRAPSASVRRQVASRTWRTPSAPSSGGVSSPSIQAR
jgi:hypothetical protein